MTPHTALLVVALFVLPPVAMAQVRCTMPNGKVITQQLSASCPQGAVKGETMDGRPIELPRIAPPVAPVKPPAPVAAAVPAPRPAAPPVAQPTTYDYAQVICKILESAGATTCEIKSNVFTESTIEATLATSPRDASASCNLVTSTVRSKTDVFKSASWKLLIFSPFSGNRPIAACRI